MLKLVFTGLIALSIIIPVIIFIRDRPDFFFWLFLNLFFDPGGYIQGFLGGNLVGLVNLSDIMIAGIVICLVSAKVSWNLIFGDQFLLSFLLLLIIFSLYYYIVYGGVIPYLNNDFNYLTFLIKNREFAYGFIILISVYMFSLRGLKYFYTVTLSIGVICLTLYFITLLTGIKLIPVLEIQRYEGSGMMRMVLYNYGIFDILFTMALAAFILSKWIILNVKYKSWLYFAGLLMLITQLITLTRRTQVQILGSIIILILIISYLFRTVKISTVFKLVMPAILSILVLSVILPKYINYITDIGEDTFLLLITGKDSEGKGDYRVSGTGDLDVVDKYINNNFFFGTGYAYTYWDDKHIARSSRGDTYALAADAAGEVPIYYLLFGYGVMGVIVILPLYYMMLRLFLKLFKLLKLTIVNYLQDPITIIICILILYTIASKFTINLYALSLDFTGSQISATAVFMGLGFALYRKLELNFYTLL